METIYPHSDDDLDISFRDQLGANPIQNITTHRRERRKSVLLSRMDRFHTSADTNLKEYRSTPSTDHLIIMKDLSVYSVMVFFHGVDLYQTQHKLEVQAANLIPVKIRDQLLAYNKDGRLTSDTFFSLNNGSLLGLMQKALRPYDVPNFNRKLNSNVKFNIAQGYTVNC